MQRVSYIEEKVCASVCAATQRYSLPRTCLLQWPRNDVQLWPVMLVIRGVKHNEIFVRKCVCVCTCVCACASNTNWIGAFPGTESLRTSGKSPPPHSQTKKMKTKQGFACTHTPSPSAWLIYRQFVLPVFCVEVADSAGGHLTISPTYCCQSLHNNTSKLSYL